MQVLSTGLINHTEDLMVGQILVNVQPISEIRAKKKNMTIKNWLLLPRNYFDDRISR